MKITHAIPRYLRSLEVLARSADTVRRQRLDLARFTAFAEVREVLQVEGIGKDLVLGFQEDLAWALTPRGERLRVTSQATILISLRGFLRWLYREDLLPVDLARVLVLPKKEEPLPKEVIEPPELRRMLGVLDGTTPYGIRDRAMLEVFYSTGVRLNELIHLRLQDLDLDGGFVYVHRGKGGKDRVVPLGEIAAASIVVYLDEARPMLACGQESEGADAPVFLNCHGRALSKHAVDTMVRRTARAAGIRKRVTPHCFRVTCVTGMLRNGANTRYLQEMLGHKSVATLDPYLKLTVTELKEMHARFHPRERMG